MEGIRRACLLWVLTGCGSQVPSAQIGAADIYTLSDLGLRLAKPISPALLAVFNRITVRQYYGALLEATSDAPFVVAGKELSGVHARLVAAANLFAELDARYSSVGEQIAAVTNLDLMPGHASVNDAFSSLANDYTRRSGVFAPIPAAAQYPLTTKKKTQLPSIHLRNGTRSQYNVAAAAALAVANSILSESHALGLVTNSLATCPTFSSVNHLQMEQNGVGMTCTGTFFKGDADYDYMLTAGHCTTDGAHSFTTTTPQNQTVSGTPIHEGNFTSEPGKGSDAWATQAQYDLGEIRFPAGTAAAYSPIATAAPMVGSTVVLAGYGNSSQSPDAGDNGVLRCGTNTVQASTMEQGMIQLTGVPTASSPTVPAGTQSLGAPGDSGSPLFNSNGEIVGVDSNGYTMSKNDAGTFGFAQYVGLNTHPSKYFISVASQYQAGTPAKQAQQGGGDYPVCTNGSNTGGGFGWQPGIGGPNNGSCRVP